MFQVTWQGNTEKKLDGLVFAPGESKLFASREEIPALIQADPQFVIVEGEGDERARGTIPRFTEVPRPEDPD
jgi:hypothetical protein